MQFSQSMSTKLQFSTWLTSTRQQFSQWTSTKLQFSTCSTVDARRRCQCPFYCAFHHALFQKNQFNTIMFFTFDFLNRKLMKILPCQFNLLILRWFFDDLSFVDYIAQGYITDKLTRVFSIELTVQSSCYFV